MGRAPILVPGIAEKHARAKAERELKAHTEKSHHTYQKDPGRVRAMTIKLDADRYKRLSRARYEYEMTAQDIFLEAVDLWFKAKHI